MPVALFIEIEPVPSGSPQYLIVPTTNGGATVLSRVSDGGRKGQNQWRPGTLPSGSASLTREPSTLVLSPADERQLAVGGSPTNLATKAQSAHDKAPTTTLTVADLGDLLGVVSTQDAVLDQWVRDGRRRHSVTQSASAPASAPFVQVNLPAAPVVPSAPTVTQTASHSDTERAKVCFVPAPEVAKHYVHRTVRGVSDFTAFDAAFTRGHCVALYGPTGSAKTTAALAYSSEHALKVAMVSGSVTLEPSQIFGQYVFDEATQGLRWQDGIVTEIVRDGGVLILDEINFIPGKIATVLFPLLQSGTRHLTLLDHGGETIKAHADFRVFATWNPRYAGTLEMNAALRNRFAVQIEWGYDDAVEKRLVKSKVLREIAGKLRAAVDSEVIYTPIPTNALVEFCDFAEDLGLDFALGNFLDRFEDDEKAQVKVSLDPLLDALRADFTSTTVSPEADVAEAVVSDDEALRTLADLNL